MRKTWSLYGKIQKDTIIRININYVSPLLSRNNPEISEKYHLKENG